MKVPTILTHSATSGKSTVETVVSFESNMNIHSPENGFIILKSRFHEGNNYINFYSFRKENINLCV